MKTSPLHYYYELEPKDNHFYSVFVDVTHKCNMECANCYVPIRDVPDLDVEKLYSALEQFPTKAEIRLIGGEPTVRKDLIEIVARIKSIGHRPTMMTNGLILAKSGYAKELVDAGMRSIYISMNGADDDEVYEIMDGVRCAKRKMQAWRECYLANMHINLGVILQKNCNDHIPDRLFRLSQEIGGYPIIRFRNVGQIGRYTLNKDQNWSMQQMIDLICRVLNKDPEEVLKWTSINGFQEKNVLFFPLDESKKIKTTWIKITDWSPYGSSIPDPGNNRRGRLTQNFKIAPFFEHVKMFENIY